MSDKEKKETKLNKIKTDLEIKLVKIELQKIKLQESQLQEDEDSEKEIVISITPYSEIVESEDEKLPKEIKSKKNKEEKKATIIAEKNEDEKEKKKSSKLFYIFGVLLLLGLISILTVKYINNLKSEIQNKEQLLLDKEKENINFDSNEFFKDVEDEVTDDELLDFTNYKDVAEIVVNNSNNNIEEVKVSETVDNQINKANITKVKPDANVVKDTSVIKKPEVTNIKENKEIIKTPKENNFLENTESAVVEEVKITSDFIKVIALQYKDKKYKIPKKVKKTNSFSIRVRLNKFKKTDFNNKVKIILVIKNAVGKTLKIDVKEVDFAEIKTTYITFYETFTDNLEVNEEYSFSILANDKLIKNITKRI